MWVVGGLYECLVCTRIVGGVGCQGWRYYVVSYLHTV